MLKRILSTTLLLVTVLLTASCGSNGAPAETLFIPKETQSASNYVVQKPMAYPDYTFDSDSPDILTMRLKAVSAFKDLLSIRWSTATPITYNKTGPVSDKTFQHAVDTTYAGTIYSNASTGLFQFMEFYDQETGRLQYPGDVEEMKETIGASCADAMIWGLTTVCNSITGPYYPVSMVYKNGFIPVGDYTYDFDISSYNLNPTYKIVEENGVDVIVDAYTKVQPGDMFTSTPDNHGMMVISFPTVIYKDDGSIDMEKSHVMIQDQRGGRGTGFYEVEEGGQIIQYSGRTSAKFTFKQLLDKSYIPVTTAEFAGLKPYEAAEVSIIGDEVKTVKDLQNLTISCNYPLAVVNLIVSDQYGNQIVLERKLFSGSKKGGVPREFALSEFAALADFSASEYNVKSYVVKIEVVPSTGQRFIPIELII